MSRRTILVAIAAITGIVGIAVGARVLSGSDEGALPDPALLGERTWVSGAWTGGDFSAARVAAFGTWRGSPLEAVTTYPAYDTWHELADSDFHVAAFDGFPGKLVYGLPLLAKSGDSTLGDVEAGEHDDVWRAVAESLVRNDRGDSIVRVGLEANGTWFDWGATADTTDEFKAAYRHVVTVMREVAPDLVFGFDITCGAPLENSDDRLASLTELYPGDDVVDVVGCDIYDSYTTRVQDYGDWLDVLRPDDAAGLADVVDFATEHGKQIAVPEWGLTKTAAEGSGDNPYFIEAMYTFFAENHEILAFENYFNEPAEYLESSLWEPTQYPLSAERYQELWS